MARGSSTAPAAKVARIMDGIIRRAGLAIVLLAASIALSGCERLFIVPAPGCRFRATAERLQGPSQSDSTSALVRTLAQDNPTGSDPRVSFSLLEQGAETSHVDPQRLLALAELADEIARTASDPSEAILWSRDAAVYASFCLTQFNVDRADAALFCAAQDVHNNSVARCLRLVQSATNFDRSDWPTRLSHVGIVPASTVPLWTKMGIDTIQLACEWKVFGAKALGQCPGLGAPVIVQHQLTDTEATFWKHFGPHDAIFAATAVIQPRGAITSWRDQPVELVLHDSVHEEVVNLSGTPIPLARDLTTPLICRLNQPRIRNYEFDGVVDPDSYLAHAGAYALDPYQPGKIPFVVVEGLWSSPALWMRMLDSLRADPRLRASYQFWVVLYPSGYPLPVAALSLRRSLREIRQNLDPLGADAALNQMVVLGKSTGGQSARMLVQPSGDGLWNAVFSRPISDIKAPPEVQNELAEMFFFQPEPCIRRVIFATTAHRGSKLARQPGVRLSVRLIRRNNPLLATWDLLREANGETVFQPFFQNRTLSSVDGIAAENPLIMALDAQTIVPAVTFHSIIAKLHRHLPLERTSDGLVPYTSAHLDGAASERLLTDGHPCEANPEFIEEVRRILLLHLSEIGATLTNADQTGRIPRPDLASTPIWSHTLVEQ